MKTKLLCTLGVFVVIYLLTFLLPRLMPGDPLQYTASGGGEDMDSQLSAEQLAALRSYYGLDRSLPQQLADTLQKNLRGDFGQSIHYKRPVVQVLAARLPWTLSLMAITLALAFGLGLGLALLSVRRPGADRALYPLLSLLGEIPPYLVGVLLLFLVAARVPWIPLSGGVTAFASFDSPLSQLLDLGVHALLPLGALTVTTLPGFYFAARACLLAVAARPFMLQGKGRGLSEGRLGRVYLLRNTLLPLLVQLCLSVGGLVTGTLLVENVFAYPGLGTALREAVRYRDYPLMQGIFLLSTVLVLASMRLAEGLGGRLHQEGV